MRGMEEEKANAIWYKHCGTRLDPVLDCVMGPEKPALDIHARRWPDNAQLWA